MAFAFKVARSMTPEVESNPPSDEEAAARRAAHRESRVIASLIRKSRNRGGGGVVKDVDWVYRHLAIAWHEINAADVPGPGAISLLSWAKQNRDQFFSTYHSRLIPSRTQLEQRDRYSDRGQVLDGLEDELLALRERGSCP